MERAHLDADKLRVADESSRPSRDVADLDELTTVEEVAALLNVSKSCVYERIAKGVEQDRLEATVLRAYKPTNVDRTKSHGERPT